MSCCRKTSGLNYSDEKNTVHSSLRMSGYDPYPELQNPLVAYGGCYPSQKENYVPVMLKRTPSGFQMVKEGFEHQKSRGNYNTLESTWHVQDRYGW